MKLKLFFTAILIALVCVVPSIAQVGIGTTTPDPSALLEIRSTNSGLLIPRLTQAQRDNIANPATGLLIYQLGIGSTFYFYDGTAWRPLVDADFWTINGNGATDPLVSLLGTSDDQDFVIKANNVEVFRITADGSVAIGTTTTQNLIQVTSTTTPALAINDGNQGAGNVLTSNGQGDATWVDPEDFANMIDGDWAYINGNLNTDPLARTGRTLIGRNPNNGPFGGRGARALLDVQLRSEILGSTIGLGSTEYYTDLDSEFTFSNDLVPITDNSVSIGNPSNRWNEVFATNGVINTSDKRDKRNIEPIYYGIKSLVKLKPVSYEWNYKASGIRNLSDKDKRKLGFIAQELIEVLPEVVQEYYWEQLEDGSYKQTKKKFAVSYSDILPVIVKSIQEHHKLIQELEEQEETITKLLKE